MAGFSSAGWLTEFLLFLKKRNEETLLSSLIFSQSSYIANILLVDCWLSDVIEFDSYQILFIFLNEIWFSSLFMSWSGIVRYNYEYYLLGTIDRPPTS